MMKPTEAGQRNDATVFGFLLDWTTGGSLFLQRQMYPVVVIVAEILAQDSLEVPFAQHNHTIQTFPPDAADHSLGKRVLPGTSRRCLHLHYPHVLDPFLEIGTVDSISVSQQILGCCIPWARLNELLCSPFRGRVSGNVEVNDLPGSMVENDRYVQNSEGRSRHRQKVHGIGVVHVILQECPPGLGRRPTGSEFPDEL